MPDLDVLELDRTLGRAEEAWRRWRRALAAGAAIDEDPFVFSRPALGRTKLEAVRALPLGDPLRVPLERWVYRLAEQRINREAIALGVGRRRVEGHPLDAPARGTWTLSAMLTQALAPTPHRAAWLDAARARSTSASLVEATLWERRQELARRLGLASADAHELAAPAAHAALEGFLRATDDLVAELGVTDLPTWLSAALAEGAGDGWPGRLNVPALAELLRDTPWVDRVELQLPSLPAPIAPASFARGLAALGGAYAHALAPPQQPFVIARDPYSLPEHLHGALLLPVLLAPGFLRRRLDVGPARLAAHRRALGGMLLCHARALALALALRGAALRGHRALGEGTEELAVRALGFPLGASSGGVLFRPRADGASRFAALLLALRWHRELVERHDEDWFWNPRAAEELRAAAGAPPPEAVDAASLSEGVAALREMIVATL